MYTLNLLPPKIQQQSAITETRQRWTRASVVLCLFIVGSFVVAGSAWFMLSRHAQSLQQQLEATRLAQSKNSATDITATTTQLNTTIKTFAAAIDVPQQWSRNAVTVLQLLPKGTSLSEFSLDAANVFHLVGTADTRQTFLNLDAALKKSPVVTNISTTSTASKRTDVPFDYTGTLTAATP